MGWCPHCKEYHPTYRDHDTCMTSCSNCGKVLQHDEFTEEPTFVKGAGGETRLAGSYVRSFQSDYSESFRRTIDKGKHKIHELAVSLGIEDGSATNLADAFYKIAVGRSFTKGRRTDQVAAACLYIACREKQKPFLLIDFSICLGVNVYVLGAVFLQLCQLLSLQEHHIVQKAFDPSLFIGRYTNVSVSMFKRTCRTHWGYCWPYRLENNEQQAFDATNNRAISLEDLRLNFGARAARRKDAAKGLCDSLARKSFEVLESLPLGEESNKFKHLAQRRALTHKHCVRIKKSQDLPRNLRRYCPRGLAAQKWAARKGYSLVDERLFEVSRLSTDERSVNWEECNQYKFSRRQGGDIVGLMALSSSEFAATSNRAVHFGQDQSGSAASHSGKKRTRQQEFLDEIDRNITLDDVKQCLGMKREDAAKELNVSVSTFKRIIRELGIKRWPHHRRERVWRPPDSLEENNLSPTRERLLTNGQIEIENYWRNIYASAEQQLLEGHVCESNYHTVPPFSESQAKPTSPHPMPTRWVKATYKDTRIKFQLHLMSGINELKEEVSKALQREVGGFDIEYEDGDGDWILMALDDNVREYLDLVASLGNQVKKLKVRGKVH